MKEKIQNMIKGMKNMNGVKKNLMLIAKENMTKVEVSQSIAMQPRSIKVIMTLIPTGKRIQFIR